MPERYRPVSCRAVLDHQLAARAAGERPLSATSWWPWTCNTTENILKFPTLTPGGELLDNAGKVFEAIDFSDAMLNTVLAAVGSLKALIVPAMINAFGIF